MASIITTESEMKTMYEKLKKPLSLFLAIIVCLGTTLFAASGCGNKEKDGKTNVRIAYFPNITHSQALVIKNQSTLEEKWADKCNVTWTSFNAGPAEIEAIFAGKIDIGYIGPVPALNANVKSNGDVKIISNSTNAGAVLLVRKGAGINSAADLAGKKIAVPQLGNTQHLCLLNILSDNGLKTVAEGGDVTITASANADILNLMDNGSIDAALVPEPWGTTIENNGNAEVLLDADEIFLNGNYPTAVVVVNKDFLDEHKDLVKEFLEAHENATLYINENIKEAEKIVNSEIEKVTGKALASDIIHNAFSRMNITAELNRKAIMSFGEISKNEGFIASVREEDNVFATEYN